MHLKGDGDDRNGNLSARGSWALNVLRIASMDTLIFVLFPADEVVFTTSSHPLGLSFLHFTFREDSSERVELLCSLN